MVVFTRGVTFEEKKMRYCCQHNIHILVVVTCQNLRMAITDEYWNLQEVLFIAMDLLFLHLLIKCIRIVLLFISF